MTVLPTLMYPKYGQEPRFDSGVETQLRIIELLESIDRTLSEINSGNAKENKTAIKA